MTETDIPTLPDYHHLPEAYARPARRAAGARADLVAALGGHTGPLPEEASDALSSAAKRIARIESGAEGRRLQHCWENLVRDFWRAERALEEL